MYAKIVQDYGQGRLFTVRRRIMSAGFLLRPRNYTADFASLNLLTIFDSFVTC